MSGVYVFLGPSLPLADAGAALDAEYLPPAAASDVYRLWRDRPRAIGIIDGYFEHAPAVWHKEILWVMERGVHVFGAAGMGALRAAELDSFGMRGVGEVYESFRDGVLERDDEVAVAYSADGTYRPLSVPMVSIRATLRSARNQQVVSAATEEVLLAACAEMFYPHRTWAGLLEAAVSSGADSGEIGTLRGWLTAGYVDQQAADALTMLREMAAFLAADPEPQRVRWTVASTTRWVSAMQRVDTVPATDSAGSR
jgi:hypothetical protein